jgi:serine/threonine protein kinase
VLAEGEEIKGYRIERLLGRGGMGEVYEATQLELERPVAFKVLHAGLADDGGLRLRFRREGQLQATLEHPHVVTVYEAGEIDEGLFLAMRLIDGVTLKRLVVAAELDPRRSLAILAPVADALDAAHAQGLVHRDVKPQNILVAPGDYPFLADFGLTRGRDQSAFTRTGQLVGTIDYVSPEQVRGEPAEASSDIYALSSVLYECLTGSVPYVRPSDAAVLYAHLNEDPPSVRAVRDDLPAGLDAVIARGMAKEPEDRPASATELISAASKELGSGLEAGGLPPPGRPVSRGARADRSATVVPAAPKAEREKGGSGATLRLRSRRMAGPGYLAIAGLVVLGVLAFLGGRSSDGTSAPKLTTSVSSESVSFRAPTNWTPTSSGERPTVPGLRLRDPVGAAPSTRDGSGAMAGMASAQGATLLPVAFAGRVIGGLPRPAAVSLGKLQALRYRDLRLRGFGPGLTVYAAPATTGVATLACYSPATSSSFESTCESIAQTLELVRGSSYPLVVSHQVERALGRSLARLSKERKARRRQLSRADTATAQADAADRLAAAYVALHRKLAKAAPGPVIGAQVDSLRAAAASAGADYRAMANSARGGDAQGFASGEQRARASEARLERALRALATLEAGKESE